MARLRLRPPIRRGASAPLPPTMSAPVWTGGYRPSWMTGPAVSGWNPQSSGLAGQPALLRPGGVALDRIETVLGEKLHHHSAGDPLTAPGQLQSHYAPDAPLRLNAAATEGDEILLGFGPVECDMNLSRDGSLSEAAANLFACLHRLDQTARPIAVSPIPDHGLGAAINDRLRRAAAPRDT